MNNLKKYQDQFVNNVIFKHENPDEELVSKMIPIGKLNQQAVIDVYATDYRFRMLEAMQTNFETIWMVLGDETFRELVFEFIKEFPSEEVDLNLYGTHFPSFLKTRNKLLEDLPFLVELASFEIQFWRVFHQANPINVDRSSFTNEKILNSTLEFDDELVLLHFPFNIFPLFQYKDKTLNEFFENNDSDVINNEAFYLLFKELGKVNCKTLTKAQFHFFSQLNKKKSLLDLINEAPDITEEETVDIFKLISNSLLQYLK